MTLAAAKTDLSDIDNGLFVIIQQTYSCTTFTF